MSYGMQSVLKALAQDGRIAMHTQRDLVHAVAMGLPLSALEALRAAGFTAQEVEQLVVSNRTQRRRAANSLRLTSVESDCVVRLLRIHAAALETFGGQEAAMAWLRRPIGEVPNQTPMATCRTEAGGRLIEGILAEIAWGAAA